MFILSRGQKVVTLILGKTFAGVLVSDFYNAYSKIVATKQKCWVHILRDIKKMEKDYPKDKEVLAFAKKIKMYFRRAMTLKSKWDQLEPEAFQKKVHRIQQTILNSGLRNLQKQGHSPSIQALNKIP